MSLRCLVRPILLLTTFVVVEAHAADQPQWGQQHSRNNVSTETGLPTSFDPGKVDIRTGEVDPATTKNVRWTAALGNRAHGSPIVADGKVFVGTNNEKPRDDRIQGDKGVLMCFDEKSGAFLWQLVVPKLYEIKYSDWHYVGISSPPTVEDGFAYLVSNRGEVTCLDVNGLADGNAGPYKQEGRHMVTDDQSPLTDSDKHADIVWLFDMVEELDVQPHNAANCSVLLDGDLLYICTSNGVEWTHEFVPSPHAPTLIVLNKKTGKLVARDDFGIGGDIVHGQWSSPAMATIDGRKQLCLGTGNGYLYGFEPFIQQTSSQGSDKTAKLKNVWHFNGHPLAQTQDVVPLDHTHDTTSYLVTAVPVYHGDSIYVPVTQECYHNMNKGWVVCVAADQTGNVTRSGLRWSYDESGASVSTVSVYDDMVFVADFGGRVHCLDANTGTPHWVQKIGGPIWGSTLVADGKVYIGNGRGEVWVLAAQKELEVIERIRMRDRVLSSITAANGALYIATSRTLYAVANDE